MHNQFQCMMEMTFIRAKPLKIWEWSSPHISWFASNGRPSNLRASYLSTLLQLRIDIVLLFVQFGRVASHRLEKISSSLRWGDSDWENFRNSVFKFTFSPKKSHTKLSLCLNGKLASIICNFKIKHGYRELREKVQRIFAD